ncbi:MAG: hypothetical protein WAO74_07680 [Polaribacter sp.]|uniref:hypothetical protein n=1 Tax=Polaribacter sp. TaxID=1920175 RepID=UPI003BB0EBA1
MTEKHIINRELKADSVVSEFFNDKEIVELGKIILFFESQMLEETKEVNTEKRYKSFLRSDSIRLLDKHRVYTFDYKKQEKLYSNLDTIFFDSFWDIGFIQDTYKKDKQYDFFNIKSYDKYGQFLEKLSKQNVFFEDYHFSTVIVNDFLSPNASSNLIVHYKNYNFKDIKVRLIYSLHYIYQNEFYFKKLKK